jgi:hypothetical protein
MKSTLAIIALIFASVTFAQPAKNLDPVKMAESAKKQETNCVTKDKKGNCPPPPKSAKPTPKKKTEEKK